MIKGNKDDTHLSLHFAMASSAISLRLISFVPLYDPSEILQITSTSLLLSLVLFSLKPHA